MRTCGTSHDVLKVKPDEHIAYMRRTYEDEGDEDDILKYEAVIIFWNFRFDLDPTCPFIVFIPILYDHKTQLEENAIGDSIT